MHVPKWKCWKELANDEKLPQYYHQLVWTFAALPGIKKIAEKKINIVLATDHGSIRVKSRPK